MRKILSTFTVDFDNVYGEELQIDGNVYDNPELLKGVYKWTSKKS